jgi:hypothetical protein
MKTGDDARRVSRRRFLADNGKGLALAGLAPALSAPFIARARAADKTLKIVQLSDYVPAYDKWFDAFVRDWGEKNGVQVTVDHIPIWSCRREPRRRLRLARAMICSAFSAPARTSTSRICSTSAR